MDPGVFERARLSLERICPYSIPKGFYIKDITKAKVLSKNMIAVAVSGVCEVVGDKLNLRTYRRPTDGALVQYKVDELRGVNKAAIDLPGHEEIEGHYMTQDVPDDMMARNQMTYEFVDDGNGNLVPNTQPDGTVQAYVHFPDPAEEMMKRAVERQKRKEEERRQIN